MRRMSAIVLFAIALFLGSLTFASATTSTDPGTDDPANPATNPATGLLNGDRTASLCDKPTGNPSDGSNSSGNDSGSGDKCADTSKDGGGDNKADNAADSKANSGGDTNGAASLAAADNGGSDLNLTSLTDQYKQIDLSPKGDSLGDSFVFSDKLYLDSGSDQVGTTDGVCVLTRLNKDKKSLSQQCVLTFSLPKGQLTAQGVIRFSAANAKDVFPIAITGGTGSYDNAGGEAHVTFLSDTKTKITVDLNR